MGNYNREYEKYYNKINKKHNTSPKQSSNIRSFSQVRKKNNESIGKYIANDILVSSIMSGCIFFSFFAVSRFNNDFGKDICNKFKTIISTDGYYKDLALEDSVIVGAISKSFNDNETEKGSNISNEDKEGEKVEKDVSKNKEINLQESSKDKISNSPEIVVESFNEFNVVEKTALDFLSESKVTAFKGKISSSNNLNFEGENAYIEGKVGQVNSILEGNIKDIKEKDGTYSVSVEYSDELEILYHNLSKINKEKGDFVKENEVLGESASNSSLNGIVIQVISDGKYINPKEYLDFLGAKDSEVR